MSLNFPNSPSTNDTHVTGGSTWIFNGEMWVRQGTRGAQGLQGLQGNQGTQGLQGLSNQGVQGNQGLQGRQGTQGLTGAFGGATFTYGFLTDTANSDPGTGNVKFNNSNLSSATTLFIDDEDDNGTDIQSYLRTIDDSTSGIKGHFKVADLANPDDFALFTITASSTEESGYFSIPVSYVSGSATSFSNGENLTVTFARTGDKGDTGIQGLQGLQGNQGVQGLSNQGVQGNQGLQGLQGNQGVQGAQGLQGNQGTQGLQGLQGNQGVQGLQGTQGNQGTQGLQGNQGTQGLQGNQGVQGLSNQGVQGLQGLQGIHSRVAISTESPSPADVGDFWYDSDDSALFIYYDSDNDGTGDQWIEIGAGPTGAQGTQGTQGLQGHQGLQGNQGVQGTQGLQGLQGNQGTQGHQGLQGNQGVQGLQGLQGNQGLQGLQGNQGTQGTQGLQGNQGVQGLQGLQGNQGIQGLQGNQGTQGTQGTQGLQGLQGLQGNQGTQGTQGVQGNQGLQGLQGLQGNQGVQGLQGISNQGVQGNQGLQGLQGNQGVQGLQGLSNQGVQGLQGRQGTQGLTGAFGGATFSYDFSTNTSGSSDPGAGKLKVNNSDLTAATLLLLDDVDENGTDIQAFLRTIDDSTSTLKGHVKVSSAVQPDNFVIYTISATSEQTGFHSVSVSYVSGSVTSFTDGQDIVATFARTGDKGDTGSQGVQGLANQGVQGLQGLQGIHSRVAISTEAPTPADVGDFWYDNDDSALFIYYDSDNDGTGDQWIEIGAGPTGAQGTQGTQGLQGLQGNQGVQGTQGLQGLQGNQGTQGHQGLQGNQGVQGAQGTQGRQGLQGVQGNQGLQGLQGNQGVQGLQGNQGTQGVQGTQGNQGTQGAQGTQGTQGLQGLQGNQGLQGLQGVQGTQGTQGLQGISGSDSYGINYTFDSSTSASDPGSGEFRFSIDWLNGSLGSAYNAYVSEADNDGIGIAGLLDTLDDSSSTNKALIVLYKKNTMTVNAKFYVTGMTDNGGWRTLDIEYIDRDGWVNISNGDDVFMSISIIGDRGSQGHQGVQGVQGNQGLQGLQGNQGLQGLQGNQGVQGLQGISNQGVQGTQGLQGRQGTQGLTGAFGGATFSYDFNTNTGASDPGAGKLKVNNANLTSATLLLLDDVDENGTDIQAFLRTIDDSTSTIKGHVKVSSSVEPDDFVIYTISATSEQTGYHQVSVSYVSGSVTSFSNGQDLVATFARTGDKGDTGNQGTQGLSNQGVQGLQGLQGIHSRVAISTESPSPADVGDFWYDNDDSALFIYYDSDNDGNGDQWIEIGAGPTGAQGTQGTQATQGVQGTQGLQGLQGNQGVQGLQGNQGTQGHQGLQGNQGVQGVQGTQGVQGLQGLQGNQGTQGAQGTQGRQGLQGLQGNQGTQGTQGRQGTQGIQGVQGRDGTNAGQGTQGLQGLAGTSAGGSNGVDYDDNVKVRFGTGNDLEIYHDGNNSFIKNNTNELKLAGKTRVVNNANSETLALFNPDGAVELYYDNAKKFETTSDGAKITGIATATTLYTSSGTFNAGNDSETNAAIVIEENSAIYTKDGTYLRNLIEKQSDIIIIGQQNTSLIDGIELKPGNDSSNGVKLHAGGTGDNVKLQTTSAGVDVTGDLTLTDTDAGSSAGPELKLYRNSASPADADYLGQIKFAGESDTGVERNYAKITGKISDASNGTEDGIIEFAHIKAGSQNISGRWNSTELQLLNGTHLSLGDSQEIRVGASDDLKLYHDGSNSYIKEGGTGSLKIQGTNLHIESATGEAFVMCTADGAVELYYDNDLHFATTSLGCKTNGDLSFRGDGDVEQILFDASDASLKFTDNKKAKFGNGDDLQIYHDGTINRVRFNVNTVFEKTDSEDMATFNPDGAVTLFYNGTARFETTSDGAKITGGLQDKDGQLGSSGQVLSSTGTALNWVDADSGPQGVQGLKGNNGSSGSNGAQGVAGSDGTIGVDGAQGTAGTQGAIGPDGGNAGTLDGLDSTAFLRSNADDTTTGNLTISKSTSPTFTVETSASSGQDALIKIAGARTSCNSCDISMIEFWNDTSSAYRMAQISAMDPSGSHTSGNGKLVFRTSSGGTLSDKLVIPHTGNPTYSGNTLWHAGNDGSGSGLDADTVDGIQASNFLRSDTADTASGMLTLNGGLTFGSSQVLVHNGTATRDKIRVWSSNSYAIGMDNGLTYGGLGNDYAMTFQMNNSSTRGWIFLDTSHTDAQGAMSLTTNGKMCLAHSLRLGYGESDTTTPGASYRLDVSGNIYSSGTVTAASDITLKKNITTIDNALDKVCNLRGVEFDYIESGEHNIGVIAQEVEKVLPELVHTDGTKSVAYGNLTAVLIEAVKELKKENDALSSRIKSLEDR